MRWADDRDPRADDILRGLFEHTGKTLVIGITGNPGSGKSTLVDSLIHHLRGLNKTVGVIAVDPSSPFSGGAILGDRIRMNRHATDEGVFIRSLATRGHLGGLSASTLDTVTIMDAMGLDAIIVETVGVGQDEVDVVRLAHATVVVVVPGLGDEVQALKAGVLEIADLFCINKSDRDGVERLERDLRLMQEFDHSAGRAFRPMIRTVAVRGQGVEELHDAIVDHAQSQAEVAQGTQRSLALSEMRLRTVIERRLSRDVLIQLQKDGSLEESSRRVERREADPYSEADALVERAVQWLSSKRG